MKSIHRYLILSCLALVATSANLRADDVQITNFGAEQFEVTTSDFTGPQTSSSLEIIGNDFGDQVYGNIPSVAINPADLTLYLQGTFTGSANTAFQIQLFDDNGNSQNYGAYFGDFTPSTPTTVSLSFIDDSGAFDGNVQMVGFLTSGTGDSIDLTMTSLTTFDPSVVPEPSTWALLAGGFLILIWRLRRSALRTN